MHAQKLTLSLGLLASLLLAAGSASASLVVYEGFEYPSGDVDGSQSGGVGMTGGWTTSTNDGGVLFDMVSGGLSFPGLDTNGAVRARRPSAPRGGEMNRAISAASQSALTGDNTTIWFSVLVRNERFSVGNENLAFAFGTDFFDANSPDGTQPTMTGGSGFGIQLWSRDPNDGTIDIFGYQSDGGTPSRSAGRVDNDTSVDTFLIAGSMEWNPSGTDDVMTLYNITGDPAAALPTPFATMSADLDQSLFDTLAIGSRQISSIDEIRFGTTALSVGVTPEPSKSMLMLIGSLGWLLRRRRSA